MIKTVYFNTDNLKPKPTTSNMKILILLFILFNTTTLKAQQANVAVGGNANGSGGTMSFSVGQVADKYVSGSNGNLNQGVQQPFEIFKLNVSDPSIDFNLYPNPTQDVIQLEITGLSNHSLQFYMYDNLGQLILSELITSAKTTINMHSLASASYLLSIIENNKTLQTFKVIKH